MKGINRLHNLRMENDQAGMDMAGMRPRFEALRTRHEDGTAPQAVAAFNLFQTPEPLAERMASLLALKGGERILEPSAGLGRLLRAVEPYKPRECVAVEVAPDCARALFAMDLPGVTLRQGDFLQIAPESLGQFDAVVMNPPFHMRADIRHIQKAFSLLRSGGRLVALCLLTDHRVKALRDWADSWEVLPAGSFKAEGTGVSVALLTKTA